MSVNPIPAYSVCGHVTVNNRTAPFVLDTGTAVTLLEEDVWNKVKQTGIKLKPWTGQILVGVDVISLVHRVTQVQFELAVGTFIANVIVVGG